MKITFEIPDESKVMNVALVFMEDDTWYCVTEMLDTHALKDGASFKIPKKKREGLNDVESD